MSTTLVIGITTLAPELVRTFVTTDSSTFANDIYLFPSMFAGMGFRNFVGAEIAKEATFVPNDPRNFSYGVGSPSGSVNKHVATVAVVPISSVNPSNPS